MSEVVVQVGLENKLRLYQHDRLVLHREDTTKLGSLHARGTGNLGNSSATIQHPKNFTNYWKLNSLLFRVPQPLQPCSAVPRA